MRAGVQNVIKLIGIHRMDKITVILKKRND